MKIFNTIAARVMDAVSVGAVCVLIAASPRTVLAQEPSAPPPDGTIKVETRVVLVDTVVTDKKGNYIRDLTANDFKVWEDGKEQPVTSFSRENNDGDPSRLQKHYMVLFFDDSTMEFGDQSKARDAAAKFVDANTDPSHYIAIVEFGGMVRVAQNFTTDSERLKRVIAGAKFSTVSPGGAMPDLASSGPPPAPASQLGAPDMGGLEADFGARSVFNAIRDLAKGLSAIPGRKSLVMLTGGFPLNFELQSELTAVISSCNRANIAVYPVDVRGLVAPVINGWTVPSQEIRGAIPHLRSVSLHYQDTLDNALLSLAPFAAEPIEPPQHGGGGGGGTGGGGGGGSTGGGGGHGGGGGGGGGTGGGGGHGGGGVYSGGNPIAANPLAVYTPNSQPRQIVPNIPDVSSNQQFLYALAEGTGGFVIVNTNDLLGGMQRIARDQSEYYLLGYKPPDSPEGSCHTLKVKVNRGGTNIRSRSGYCRARPRDLLAGTTTEKDLETRASGEMPGNVTAFMRTPYFYSEPNVARVHLVMDIPSQSLEFQKVKGKEHAEINVLGIAYKPDGSIAARFSDTVPIDLDGKKEVEEFQKAPFHYENQFEAACGTYNLRVVFSSGSKTFGKLENPFAILPFDGKQISLSSIALSNNTAKVSELDTALDSQLVDDRKPLVVRGVQILPSASNHFKKTDNAVAYIEVYDPLLAKDKPPQLGLEFRIVDKKTGDKKLDVGVMDTQDLIKPGNPVVPVGVKLPLATLAPGTYRVDLRAQDSEGNSTNFRIAEFELE